MKSAKGKDNNAEIFIQTHVKNNERKMIMNKKTAFLYTVIACFAVLSQIISAQGFSWYFKPQSDGKQPLMCPEADFVKNYDVVTVGDQESKKIYLTFDAGYENGNVEKILDVLKENDVKGTFFLLPNIVEKNTELCKRMKEEGHLAGNHTVHHANMGKINDMDTFKKEIQPLEEFFYEKTGYEMDKFFRPPEGAFNETTLKYAQELGYTTVFWSLAYADWDNNKQMNPEKAKNLLLSRMHNGCVLLLHPTSKTNADMLDGFIKELKGQGYEFGTVDELRK